MPLRPLWQQFDDQIQDDASHFLMALADLAESARIIPGYYHVDHRQQVHKRKSFPIHLISPGDQPEQELEQLIAQWANQGEGQVADGRGLWVGQIGRYDLIEGEWTKHHQILNVPTIFNLPYTLDGNETKTAPEWLGSFGWAPLPLWQSAPEWSLFCHLCVQRGLLAGR